MVIINGEKMDIKDITISEYLKTTEYDITRIAVEQNGIIIPKKTIMKLILKTAMF